MHLRMCRLNYIHRLTFRHNYQHRQVNYVLSYNLKYKINNTLYCFIELSNKSVNFLCLKNVYI